MKALLIRSLILTLAIATSAPGQPTLEAPALTRPAASPPSPELDEIRRKLEAVELQLKDRNELFTQLDKFFWLVTALSGVGALLTIWTIFRETFGKRERTLARNEMKHSEEMGKHAEKAALAHVSTLENFSGLIQFVHDAFDLQNKQKEALDKLRDQQESDFNTAVKKLRDEFVPLHEAVKAASQREENRKQEATAKYAHVVGLMTTFEGTQALEWPTQQSFVFKMADTARIEMAAIPPDLLKELIASRPNEHAAMLQRMGVAAYYDEYQIDTAMTFLGDAERLFEVSHDDGKFNKVRAYTQHFLALIEKNWCLEGNGVGPNLADAANRLRKAVEILGSDPDHFLTPVTLAEVLSYCDGEHAWKEACSHLDAIIAKHNQATAPLNKNQIALYTRALLLRGNIELRRAIAKGTFKSNPVARKWYKRAADTTARNPYALLSLARSLEPFPLPNASSNKDDWQEGLDALIKSDALVKPEMTQRVTAIVWAIIAASRINDDGKVTQFRGELIKCGANRTFAGRIPLFFSPFNMTVMSFDDLSKSLENLLKSDTQ